MTTPVSGSTRPKVGLVHFGGNMGDMVRVAAIRQCLQRQGLLSAEYRLIQHRPPVDMVRELFSVAGMRHLGRKILGNRMHPLLKELHWRIEARQWEDNVGRAWSDIRDATSACDVLLGETLFGAMVCLRAKEQRGIPFVFDMHGVLCEEAKLSGAGEWVEWCCRWERTVIAAADRVVVVSPLMADYVRARYDVPPERLVLAPNGTHLPERTAGWARPQTVVYAGNFAGFENIINVVKTAESLCAGRPFWLLGDGPLRQEVFDYINERSLDVLYWGRRKRDDALALCARAQVGLSGQTGATDLARDYPLQLGCPIKLFDYAACGLPVVAPPGEWAPVLEQAGCAVIARDGSAGALADAVAALDDERLWTRMSRAARAMAQDYRWPKVLEPLAEALETTR